MTTISIQNSYKNLKYHKIKSAWQHLAWTLNTKLLQLHRQVLELKLMDCWRDMTPCIILSYIFCVQNVEKLPIRSGTQLNHEAYSPPYTIPNCPEPRTSSAKIWYNWPMSDIRSSGSSDTSPSETTTFTVFGENKLEICNNGRTRITCSHFTTMEYMQIVSTIQAICWINNSYSINSLIQTLEVHHCSQTATWFANHVIYCYW